jgi:antitoxin CcdA
MGKTELKLEIDTELLEEASRRGVKLAAATEYGIRVALGRTDPERPIGIAAAMEYQKQHPEEAEARAKAWAEENAEAIESYRRRIEEYGVFGDDLRRW